MLHIRKLYVSALIALGITSLITTHGFQLTDYDYKSASVLPTFIDKRGTKWVDVGREAFGITKKYTYDDYSGSRDKGEHNSKTSAEREFFEEHMLKRELGWNLSDVEKFVSEHTEVVIVYSQDKNPCDPQSRKIRNVTFIVDVTEHAQELFDNFYDARKKEEARYNKLGTPKRHRVTTEKDKIAKVKWNDFERAIKKYSDTSKPLYVQAWVMNPKTKRFRREKITLRPFLGIKLRPFFLDQDYEEGENEQIRFYTDTSGRAAEDIYASS